MSRRALVTGATGGLGLTLTQALLDNGYAVRATGRSPTAINRLREIGADAIAGDLFELGPDGLCGDIDVVFHAAALSSPWGPDADFQRANVDLTRDLLDAAQRSGVGSFVFVSSPSVYARWADQTGLTEDTPWPERPLNAYSRTKGEAERLVLAADAPGFRTVAIRPRAIIGPDDAVLLPRILRLIRRGRAPLFRDGRALVELTDVRDAACAILLADVHREAAGGQAINISGGQALPIRDLVHRLGQALGVEVRTVSIPLVLGQLLSVGAAALGRVLPGRPEPVLTPYTLSTMAWSQTFDLSKARRLLSYEPAHDAVATALAIAPGLATS
ncbi:NAD(P)-dependent oxidoreductase [Brevundimonas sp.]|uniref:NAD-dependent epimerase/dehydratase family protein n=1 Tax=Brevundimonas sp. TaxID=1871086 RepID=UPI00273205FA|nr:NAD-dependent epimerase/dehydratase family protein [Brevundimonas sp.]MDP1913479.1 NAD-dependent epimerase/dehydratase family protein [Brevundimonas sp.]